MTSRDELDAILAPHGQSRVLRFWDRLSRLEREALAEAIRGLDLGQLKVLWRGGAVGDDIRELARRAKAPTAFRKQGTGNPITASDARRAGAEALAAGRVGVLLVAGGQGTRLGFDRPKGMYEIGPVSGASLFRILLEKLVATRDRYSVSIPLYIMTSALTHDETERYLRENDYLGLPAADVCLFRQGTMPAVDIENGELLLSGPGELSLSPDGHGGMPTAMARSGVLDDARKRGVDLFFYLQVDNPLVVMCDAEFLGYHLLSGSELSTQVVAKRTPLDRVGNVVSIDGQTRIIEYSDLPDEAAHRRDSRGELELWAGNIAVHVFDLELLARASQAGGQLPFHLARKRVPFLDDAGRRQEPAQPNAIKFERFIFDLLPQARQAIVMEVDEDRVFAPLKNAPGENRDTPETVQARMVALHSEWLREAGARVADGVPVEISPRFALDAESLPGKIPPGTVISEPTYFGPT